MLGLAAAFVFAAQMLNFPVAGGTSGHLVGGVLTAVLLGPSAAVLVITCVLIVQCLMFADGGLIALGANIFNMGIVSVCGGYFVFRLAESSFRAEENRVDRLRRRLCGLVWHGAGLDFLRRTTRPGQTVPWSLAFPAMANVHMLIGIGEGLATGLVLWRFCAAGRSLVAGSREKGAAARAWLCRLWPAGFAIGLALFVAPFACPPGRTGWRPSPRPSGFEQQAQLAGLARPFAGLPGALDRLRHRGHRRSPVCSAPCLLSSPLTPSPGYWSRLWARQEGCTFRELNRAGARVLHRAPAPAQAGRGAGAHRRHGLAAPPAGPALPRCPPACWLLLWPFGRMPLGYTLAPAPARRVLHPGHRPAVVVAPAAAPVFLSAVLKSNLCVFTMLLLTWTTPFHEILQVLRRLRLPRRHAHHPGPDVSLPARARRGIPAHAARPSQPHLLAPAPLAWHNLTAIIGQLFVRSADRAERIYLAMCARGWK